MEALTTIQDVGQKLINAPSWVVLVLFLNVVGFALKRWPQFPNKLIPVVVIIVGIILYPPLAGRVFGVQDPSGMSSFGVVIVRCMTGGVFGFGAWGLHGLFKKAVKKVFPDFSDEDDGDCDQKPTTKP